MCLVVRLLAQCGEIDHDSKPGGASSEPAFHVGQVCLRVRKFFGLTSELSAAGQIYHGQRSALAEYHYNVTCSKTRAVGVYV